MLRTRQHEACAQAAAWCGRLLQAERDALALRDGRVVFQRLAACARPCGGYGIRSLNQHGLNGTGLHISVVSLYSVNDLIVLAVPLGKIRTDLCVRAFHLVIHSFADIVQQTCSLCKGNVCAQLGGHHAGEVSHLY